jgi:pyruvate formate lyase activating enzyme
MKEDIQIKGFIETSFVDWEDKITAVIFLPYCNLRCPYCQNPELVLHPESLESIDIDDILGRLKKYTGWIDGICITGGEPTLHKWLPDLVRHIKKSSNLLVKIDTNGTNPEMLKNLINEKLVDAVSMDVKAPLDDIRYCKAAGVAVNLEDIKKSIDILKKSGLLVEFRTTVHPAFFSKKDVEDLALQLKGVERFKLQNFNIRADTIDPVLKGSGTFTEEEFDELKKIADNILRDK